MMRGLRLGTKIMKMFKTIFQKLLQLYMVDFLKRLGVLHSMKPPYEGNVKGICIEAGFKIAHSKPANLYRSLSHQPRMVWAGVAVR